MPAVAEQRALEVRRAAGKGARPVRVLHVIPALQMGGAERMLADLFRTLDDSPGVELQLCALREPTYLYRGFAPRNGVRVVPFRSTWRSVGAVRRCVRELGGLIDEFEPDVLHTHLWLAHYLVGLAAAGLGTPHLAHIHNTWDWMASARPGFRLRKWVFRRVLQRSGAEFIACSDAAGVYYRQHLRLEDAAMTTIPYGINAEVFRAEGPERRADFQSAPREMGDVEHGRTDWQSVLRIGTAGRFVPEKGHGDLLRAVAELKREGVACRLSLAGQGPMEGEYRRTVRELGLEEEVEFAGLVEDMAAYYRSLDVYVQPSWSAEGLPLSILEAMSSACCVVAADVAGAREAVRDGETGLLVRSRDVGGLAAALRRACADEKLRLRLGRAARREVEERFSAEGMCTRVMELYGRLVKR
jgi:glycosyltransferase involved in cell wall biosynthesis